MLRKGYVTKIGQEKNPLEISYKYGNEITLIPLFYLLFLFLPEYEKKCVRAKKNQ